MAQHEQKLLFTREGKYTLWEMLNHLDETQLRKIYMIAFDSKFIETIPSNINQYPNALYKIYDSLNTPFDREKILQEIQTAFTESKTPRYEFNCILYKFKGLVLPYKDIVESLSNLYFSNDEKEKLESFKIDFQIKSTLSKVPVIDIIFSSTRTEGYKGNDLQRKINTEIRIYPDVNLALMTNYNDYTHSESQKNSFITNTIAAITNSNTVVRPTILQDHSLRSLLLMKDVNPSKMKFDVDGRLQVGIKILQDQNIDSAINQEEIKRFYHQYEISQIAITISEAEEKYLYIDGRHGKLISRNKNLELKDIDHFIYQLKSLLKYDYVYVNYRKNLLKRALRKLNSTSSSISNYVDSLIKETKKVIYEKTKDETQVFNTIIENVFFTTLIEGNIFRADDSINNDEMFSPDTALYLIKIFEEEIKDIEIHLNAIIKLYEESNKTLEVFLNKIDEELSSLRMEINVISA